ncbi:hypothetical protein F5146DRAFT_1005368 [Armillaria mellea]|nr:hypothetical protein F5146DRAFT_1005368 [Armillaria mellea]
MCWIWDLQCINSLSDRVSGMLAYLSFSNALCVIPVLRLGPCTCCQKGHKRCRSLAQQPGDQDQLADILFQAARSSNEAIAHQVVQIKHCKLIIALEISNMDMLVSNLMSSLLSIRCNAPEKEAVPVLKKMVHQYPLLQHLMEVELLKLDDPNLSPAYNKPPENEASNPTSTEHNPEFLLVWSCSNLIFNDNHDDAIEVSLSVTSSHDLNNPTSVWTTEATDKGFLKDFLVQERSPRKTVTTTISSYDVGILYGSGFEAYTSVKYHASYARVWLFKGNLRPGTKDLPSRPNIYFMKIKLCIPHMKMLTASTHPMESLQLVAIFSPRLFISMLDFFLTHLS